MIIRALFIKFHLKCQLVTDVGSVVLRSRTNGKIGIVPFIEVRHQVQSTCHLLQHFSMIFFHIFTTQSSANPGKHRRCSLKFAEQMHVCNHFTHHTQHSFDVLYNSKDNEYVRRQRICSEQVRLVRAKYNSRDNIVIESR